MTAPEPGFLALEDVVALVLSVAEGRTLKPEVANALRLHAAPSRP